MKRFFRLAKCADLPARPAQVGRFWPWLLPLAVLAVFGRVTAFDFVNYDDFMHVSENPLITGISAENLARIWRGPIEGLYMPLTYTLWGGLALLSRWLPVGGGAFPDPFWYHAANLLVHLGAASLLFLLLRLLLRDEAGALVGALFFALHPVQVEAVAWVSGFKGLLGGLFALTALWFYLRFALTAETVGRHRFFLYLTAAGFFGVGLLASPMAVTTPLLAALLGRLATGRPWPRLLLELGPWLLLALPLMVVTKQAQPDATQLFLPTYFQRFLVAGDAASFYLGKLLWPFVLAPDYGRRPLQVLAESRVYWSALLPLLLLALLAWKCRQPKIWLATGLLVLPLLPVLGLIPFDFQKISTVADRYLYLSLSGPALLLGWLHTRYRTRLLTGLVLLLLVLLGGRSLLLLGNWRDSYTLNRHALAVNPDSGIAHANLGVAYLDDGRVEEAVIHFRRAIEVAPYRVEAYINLGNIASRQGRQSEAAGYYQQALALAPDDAQVAFRLGETYLRLGNHATALLYLRQAAAADPGQPLTLATMGLAARGMGRCQEAIEFYRQALTIRPDFAEAYNNLGQLYGELGRYQEALASLKRAVALEPGLAEAYNNLGEVYLKMQQPAEAIAPLRKASELRPSHPLPYLNLARAWRLLGREDLAGASAARAASLGQQAEIR